MAGEFVAGSILVELKAQYNDLKKNLQASKKEITGFGASVDATSKTVGAGGQRISDSFDAMDKSSIRAAARVTRLIGVLFTAQHVMDQFSGDGGNKGLAAATSGLTTFAAVSAAIPNPIGIALAAVAGLTTGLVGYGKAMGEAVGGTKDFQAAIEAVSKARLDFTAQKTLVGLTSGKTLGLDSLRIEVDEASDILNRAIRDIARLKEANRFGFGTADQAALLAQREALAEAQAKALLAKRRDLAAAEAVKDRQALEASNKTLLDGTAIQLQAGLISPLEAIQAEAQAARRELDALLADPNRDNTALGLALDRAKAAQSKVDTRKNLDSIADGFGGAFSNSLRDAILNQKKPMEALADLGGSLFENALSDAMKQVQSGLAAAIKGISGGSDVVGGSLTAVLGIGGALLSRRGSKSTEQFSAVQSLVTDSRELRGIVAGPSSVAVATVTEDIARAMAPAVDLLTLIARFTNKIELNTRGGRGAGAQGGAEAVFVPTA